MLLCKLSNATGQRLARRLQGLRNKTKGISDLARQFSLKNFIQIIGAFTDSQILNCSEKCDLKMKRFKLLQTLSTLWMFEKTRALIQAQALGLLKF